MSSNLYDLIKAKQLRVYPDDAMRVSISHAVAIESSRGWRIAKLKASHRIDSVVALAMAAHACVQDATRPPRIATTEPFFLFEAFSYEF